MLVGDLTHQGEGWALVSVYDPRFSDILVRVWSSQVWLTEFQLIEQVE